MLSCDQYLMPETLGEALAQWAGAPPGSRLIAGATDTLPWARQGRAGDVHVPVVIDVSKVAELQGYEVSDDRVRLGANLVLQRFLSDDTLKGLFVDVAPSVEQALADAVVEYGENARIAVIPKGPYVLAQVAS